SSPATAPALLEFAEFEIDDRHFDEALAILDDARLLHPDPGLLNRIDFVSAQAHYLARRFDTATAAFEQIAHRDSPWTNAPLFIASLLDWRRNRRFWFMWPGPGEPLRRRSGQISSGSGWKGQPARTNRKSWSAQSDSSTSMSNRLSLRRSG